MKTSNPPTLYDSRGEPVRIEAKSKWRLRLAWGAIALEVLYIVGVSAHWLRHEVPNAAVGPTYQGQIEVVDGYYARALDRALESWQISLNRSIQRPRLYFGAACGSPYYLACADRQAYTITFSESINRVDEYTVFLHELGHLLGVPHIEGDPLMNSSYTVSVPRPTAMAVAIAKLEVTR